jgi:hypothetical protein
LSDVIDIIIDDLEMSRCRTLFSSKVQ